MSIEEISNSNLDDFDKIFFFRNVSEYIAWKRNMLNRLKILNFFEYIEEEKFFELSIEERKYWKNSNRRICAIVRMRFDFNAQKIVENKSFVKDIWDIIAAEYKFKGFDHVNFAYETLDNYKLFFFSSIDDYCDKFIELVFKVEAFVFAEGDHIFEILLIHRFHMNFDFNFQQYCENYFQTHDVFDEDDKVKFILFYVIKRLINVVIAFNINTFVFVIGFHVCTDSKCFHSYSAFVASNISTDPIIQNEIVSRLFSKIIIKLIFYCTHCDKDYHDKNHCEILHFELKKKRLANRRNRSSNGDDNKNDNDNSRRNRNNNSNDNNNNNDNGNKNNNNDNQIAKRINNNSNNIKKFKFLKVFIVVNSDFLEKQTNMIIENIFFEIT